MANYSFIIKKGKYRLELITTDRELLSEQFEQWVHSAGDYVLQKKMLEHKNAMDTQIQEEEKITQKNIEKQIRKTEPEKVEIKEEPDPKNEETQLKEDLDIFYSVPASETPEEESKTQPSESVFDSILDNSMKNPQTEVSFKSSPSIKKDNAFINFMGDKKIDKKIDYLLLTAYYFSQFEQKPRFTLKQLNSKLMQNLAVIIDHSVLQEAINRDYIECLPDLTGLVGASEYRLTAYGEKTILDA